MVQTGVTAGTLPVQRVSVDHLSTRYVEFLRGNNDPSIACYAATLTLIVTMPAGVQSKPTFYWDGPGSAPVPLTINGNTASAAIPWDTCTWGVNEGFLSIPNASVNIDAADFVVNQSLSVNTALPAAPSEAPDPLSVWGQVVQVPSVQLPPTVFVYGPELLTLSATDKQLRLIVQSSGDGSLQASIGSTSLGAGTLSAGNNDLRFTLPASVLQSLRRSANVSNILTLTAVAASGGAQGQTITRHVLIQGVTKKPTTPAKPAKPKAKPKPKPKSKSHK